MTLISSGINVPNTFTDETMFRHHVVLLMLYITGNRVKRELVSDIGKSPLAAYPKLKDFLKYNL